jgi:hypothetical protein
MLRWRRISASTQEPPMKPMNAMNAKVAGTAHRALADSALALLAGCVGVAMFLPPLAVGTAASLPRSVVAGLVVALALPLHWIFLAIGARRMGASVPGWVGLSVALFPVGGAAALILLGGLLDEPDGQPQVAR